MRTFDHLLTLSEEEQNNAVSKYCGITEGSECCINTPDCFSCYMKWLASEWNEPKHYTAEEVALAKMIGDEYKWVARDKDGYAYVFRYKPSKYDDEIWSADDFNLEITDNFICDFPSVKWEDDEPTSLDEIRIYKE